ncbi:MAG: aspartyl-tRNA(Asn)/glutamyl-tRNA(Gln) amidotransferase subunit, partial [Pseudonocardiales bacterium]|nr:aspartyl-tRNA(Asn)/glutamyl-tRNA(Gln) amidotransferase subunit [Pseudonocardiales bacterium]
DPAHGNRWSDPVSGIGRHSDQYHSQPLTSGIGEVLAGYRDGGTEPVGVVTEALAKCKRVHERLNCTIATLDDRALAAAEDSARRWADGRPRALEGVPFAVKDVIDVAGVPTTNGSWVYGDRPAAESATVVRRLEEAGAIPISKDATTEFAVGGPHPPRFGACRNPWDPERWAGGSSTGTAAVVATRVVPFGLGTDVGGSVRLPSAWCGLTGLKPTAGVVPRTGVFPLSPTTETVGPLAVSAVDAALVFAVIRGPDGHDPRIGDPATFPPFEPPEEPADLAGLRIALPGGYLTELCDGAVRDGVAALVEVLTDAGASVVAGELPSAAEALPIGYQIVFTEAAALHRVNAARWSEYDPVLVRRISQGITTPAVDYLRALAFRAELQRELDTVFAAADLIVVPTCPSTAPRLPECAVVVDGVEYPLYAAQSRSTMLGNLTGAPGLALPTGFAPDGCPVSAQLIAAPHREELALRVARLFQARTDHHRRVPPVPA